LQRAWSPADYRPVIGTSAADLKFLHRLPQARV